MLSKGMVQQKLTNYDEQEIKKIWDTAYLETDDRERKIIWSRLDYLLFKRVKKHVDSKSLVLEAGCGVSGIMNLLISQKIQVIGVDISSVALNRANKLLRKPLLIQADIHHLPLRDDLFDLVYNVGVMEHFVNPEKPLKEIVKVLKPSGIVVIAVPNKFNMWSLGKMSIDLLSRLYLTKPWKYGYEKPYTKYGIKNLLNSIGLKATSVSGCGVFEGLYITVFFSLRKPKLLLQYLEQYLFSDSPSTQGTTLRIIAETLEKIDIFGLHVVAYGQKK
jgi:ubiquinone/menaquinone biosynthesis C-methylase UbiE